MQIVTTRACIKCGGKADMREDVELNVRELPQDVGANVIVRHDPPPKLKVRG